MAEEHVERMQRPWFRGQMCNFTVGHLLTHREPSRPLAEGERALFWFILPPFQRPPVWAQEQQRLFVESLWDGLPVGAYVYNYAPEIEGKRTNYWLIDGQQRLTALQAYFNDEFAIHGWRWSEVTDIDRRRFDFVTPLPAYVTQYEEEATLREVYNRLAYGGTAHKPEERA